MNDDADNPVCRRFHVSGRVQRVGFRAATTARARELGLTGYARNLPDGRVEVLACGPPEAVASLESWLWKGPVLASVNEVAAEPAQDAAPEGFSTA